MKLSKKILKEGIIFSFILTVWLKLVLTLVGYNLSFYFKDLPLTTAQMDLSELIPRDKQTFWYYVAQSFHRFDALWYEAVAKTSYREFSLATPFFPLYPILVDFLSLIFRTSFYIVAYFLNFFLTFFVFFLLYLLVFQEEKDKTLAQKTVMLFALFPSSFFLFTPYAESLLFSFFLLSIILAKKRRFCFSSLAGFFAAMTKPYGFLIFLPLLSLVIQEKKLQEKIKKIFWLLMIPLGTIIVLVFQNLMIGEEKLEIVKGISGWGMGLVNPFIRIWDAFLLFARHPADLPNVLNLLTIGIVFFYLISYRPKRKRDFSTTAFFYWFYVLVFFFVFAFYQPKGVPLKSFGRYFLTFFPIFIFIAKIKTGLLVSSLYIVTSVTLMIIFFIYYVFGFFTF